MDAASLIRLRLEMEFGAPVGGVRLPPARAHADNQPRVFVNRYAGGHASFYRHDLPDATRAALERLAPARAFDDPATMSAILGVDAPVGRCWRVRWYVCERAEPPTAYRDVTSTSDGFVIVRDGVVASRAWTAAECPGAREVEVETHPDFLRRGYALQVVGAWATAALAAGVVPFYSHVVTNDASRGVAASLGLTWLADEARWA